MSLDTKIRDEKLFKIIVTSANDINVNVHSYISFLEKKNIITVEDFLNTDFDSMKIQIRTRMMYRIIKDVLNYKYNGIKMVRDVELEKIITKDQFQNSFWMILFNIGLKISSDTRHILYKLDFGESIKLIDVLKEVSKIEKERSAVKELTDFYIEYYENEIQKEFNSSCNGIVEEKTTIASLKDELVRLLNQRNALDKKISELLEQVNALEGEITNGRK